jgi:hypothetical protein
LEIALMFRNLFRSRRSAPAIRRPSRPRFHPRLEGLEDRFLPSQVNWIGVTDGDFNNPANWQDQSTGVNRVPLAGDYAVIGTPNITVTASTSDTVDHLYSNANLVVAGGTFTVQNILGNTTINGASVVDSGAALNTTGGNTYVNGGSIFGNLNVANGGLLDFTNGTANLDAGTSLTGLGQFWVGGGVVSVNTPLNAPQNLYLNSDTLALNATFTVPSGATLNWNGGSTLGSGTGSAVIASGATLALSGPGTKVLNQDTLTNNGTMTWTGTADMEIDNAGVFNNAGSFTIQNDQTIHSYGSIGTINNSGTWSKADPGQPNATAIDPLFNNTGTVSVTNGILNDYSGGISSGAFVVSGGQTLGWLNGTYTLQTGATLAGTGTYHVGGAALYDDVDVSVANLTMDGGYIAGTNTMTVAGTFNWSSGSTLYSNVVVASQAALDMSGPGNKVISAATLTNDGTGTWTGTADMEVDSSAVFDNNGTFKVQNDQTIRSYYNPGTINNAGTWNKSTAGPVPGAVDPSTTVDPIFNNTGIVHVISGIMELVGTGTNSKTFTVDTGADLGVSNATYIQGTTGTMGGTGTYSLDGGDLQILGSVSPANFTMDGGYLSGPGTLTATNLFNWSSGSTMDLAVTVVIPNGSTLSMSGPGNKVVNGATLTNKGTGTWTGTADMEVDSSGVFNNSGSFSMQNDQTIRSYYNIGTINNTGTWTKADPLVAGASAILPIFNNTGTVAVTNGSLYVNSGGISTGTFNTSPSQLLAFNGGTYTLDPGTSIIGTGVADVIGGGVDVNGHVNAATFEVDGGTLYGTGNLTVTGAFTWNSGSIANTGGQVTLPAGSTLSIQGDSGKYFSSDGVIVSAAATTWTGKGNLNFSGGSTFTNQGKGVFSIQNDQIMTATSGGGNFNNSGVVDKAGGAATTTIAVALNNTGKVQVHSNTLSVTGPVSQVSGSTLTGGSWAAYGSSSTPATLSLNSAGLTTIGSGAAVTLSGLQSTFSDIVNLNSDAGSFSILAGQSFTAVGAFNLSGTATVDAGSNLNVGGNFVEMGSGTLAINDGGTSTSPTVGHVNVASSGTVSLAGKLGGSATVTVPIGTKAVLINNQGSATVGGTFAGLPEGSTVVVNGMTFKISYVGGTGNDVTATRIA